MMARSTLARWEFRDSAFYATLINSAQQDEILLSQ
jgi:hypothetical protein